MIKNLGKVLYEDNFRRIVKIEFTDGTKHFIVKEMQKHCFYCKKKVHRDSGKYLMSSLIPKLKRPKFFCFKHSLEVLHLLKLWNALRTK